MAVAGKVSSIKRDLLVGGAVLLPFGILMAYLFVTRSGTPKFSESGDFLALGVATAIGSFCLWHLVRRADFRVITMVVYSLICFATLFFFTFWFLCAAFGECL